jgi:aminopeptidase N
MTSIERIKVRVLALIFVSAACPLTHASAAAPAASPAHPSREVLPDGVVPVHYDLTLAPDSETLTFRGKVAVTLDVRTATASVTLNAVGLTFDHATLDGGKDAVVTLDDKLGRATLDFGAAAPPGKHVLSIEYHGKIGQTTLGFFAMDYSSPEGRRRTLATNFEPSSARELLPCWDEPARKATFTVSVEAPRDRMALSNMPVAEVEPLSATMQRVRFATTPKMSTYLLFVGVGDFERVHATVDGIDVGVVVKRGDTAKASYALDQAGKILHYYNDYFGVAFPLPKLDLIAAPGQIQGGSMENWGAIFYSQNHLLFDPKTSTEADRQEVFEVVAHEMAHQWFGDLVTMAWWDDLWLNEGFARWMQTFVADALHPEWETGLQALAIFEGGKHADAVPSTHPVVQEVFTADQAAESFDAITYNKGAAIITMINAYAGRDKFRDGVRRYMRAHAYGNTVDVDLWRLIQEAVGKPIVEIERDFTRQVGVPLVTVTSTPAGVHLEQSRFAADPSTIAGLAPLHWRLPLAVVTANADSAAADRPYLLLQGAADVAQSRPLLVNAGQTGYARVLYTDGTFEGVAAKMSSLMPADQIGLIDDARALGFAGYLPPDDMLKLAVGIPAEANAIVWERVIRLLSELDDHYADSPQRAVFRRFALDVVAPLAARLGSAGAADEPSNIAILRSNLKHARGRFGDSAVIADARRLFDQGGGTVAEQRTALDIVAENADVKTFDLLLARAAKTLDPLEKQHITQALAGVSDPALARRFVEIALSRDVPAGSAPRLLVGLARRHPDAVWEVLAPRLDTAGLPIDKTDQWETAGQIAGYSADPKRIAELEAYETRSVPADARKPFLGSVASIRQNQRIATNVLPLLDRWIAARGAPTARR